MGRKTDAGQTTAETARARLFGGGAARPARPAPSPEPTDVSPDAPPRKRKKSGGKKAEKPTAGKGGSNYLGGGLYLYKGRQARKMSVYVSPELVPALKAAGASGKDPRGNDMSEIVETLIREAGYGG